MLPCLFAAGNIALRARAVRQMVGGLVAL